MEDKKHRKNNQPGPYIPDVDVPDPPVPNRAHTEMSLGDFGGEGGVVQNNALLGNFEPKTGKKK